MSQNGELKLKAGEWVEVRSADEILATLDAGGKLDSMPFMPEMLRFAGQRMQVVARADKTCDTVTKTGGRRLLRTVHLDTRCDGSAHGGCQAACNLFWKEAWLKRADGPGSRRSTSQPRGGITLVQLQAATQRTSDPASGEVLYQCQATQLAEATTLLPWWDFRQYWRDWRSGNVKLGRMLRVLSIASFNALQRWRGGVQYPAMRGKVSDKTTPSMNLGLKTGEQVRVKRIEDIVSTLNADGKNRGMRFDQEMVRYCGSQYTVRHRVERIIEEHTGRMLHFANECIVLDGVTCRSECSPKRLLCPRSIYPYWREIWLERVHAGAGSEPVQTLAAGHSTATHG